jgi:hypothetical protein
LFPFLFSSYEQDCECCKCHALQHHGEGHEEANRPPHAAKVSIVAAAIFVSWKLGAVVGGGNGKRNIGWWETRVGAPLMESVAVVYRSSVVLARVREDCLGASMNLLCFHHMLSNLEQ